MTKDPTDHRSNDQWLDETLSHLLGNYWSNETKDRNIWYDEARAQLSQLIAERERLARIDSGLDVYNEIHENWLFSKGWSEPCAVCMGETDSLEHDGLFANLQSLNQPNKEDL